MWWVWVFVVIGIYLLASLCTTIWYIVTPTVKPSKFLDYFCYPIGLIIVLWAALTHRIK